MSSFAGRYAVLHHSNITEPHYDLLFETSPRSDLATWRLPAWPVDEQTPATRLRDHRRLYLDFEGDIGGVNGRVDRIAGGTCESSIDEFGEWAVRLIDGTAPVTLGLSPTSDPAQWIVSSNPFL